MHTAVCDVRTSVMIAATLPSKKLTDRLLVSGCWYIHK